MFNFKTSNTNIFNFLCICDSLITACKFQLISEEHDITVQ
jgi:hypothetical protein